MRLQLIKKYLLCAWFALCVSLAYSCKDEEHFDVKGESGNKVYFPVQNLSVNAYNKYVFSISHTPLGSIGSEIKVSLPIQSTQVAQNEITAECSVSNTAWADYNATNGTAYSKLPDGLANIENLKLTINKGEMESSQTLVFNIPTEKYASLVDSAYLVPIQLSSVGGDGNAAVSANRNIFYVIIHTNNTNVYNSSVSADMTGIGTLVASRSAWSATLTATPTTGSLTQSFDGSASSPTTSSYWTLAPPQKASLVVDLGSSIRVAGIRTHCSSTTYAFLSAAVSISVDGVNWTAQGTSALSISSAYQYVKFYAPVSARYIKYDILSWHSATAIRFADFNVYVAP